MRRAAFVFVPLLAASWLGAHALAYQIALPESLARASHLEATGHSYLPLAHVVVAYALACALVALVLVVARPSSVRKAEVPRLFAVVPLLGFALQELLERFLHDSQLSVHVLAEPTFLLGVALQVPLALAALVLARALLAGAGALGARLAGRTAPARLRKRAIRFSYRSPDVRRDPILALRCAGRAPPVAR